VFAATGAGVPVALHTLFDRAAARISRVEATYDPAGVSGPLKLLADRSVVATRLRKAADGLAEASATTPTTPPGPDDVLLTEQPWDGKVSAHIASVCWSCWPTTGPARGPR
jgi:hypothetical protein